MTLEHLAIGGLTLWVIAHEARISYIESFLRGLRGLGHRLGRLR